MAKEKLSEAENTMMTRLREAWCWLIYPVQENAKEEIDWMAGKVAAQDNVLSRSSKKLVSEEGLLPELGPARLDRDLQKYIWNDKPHLSLKDLWEYLNRYTYLPRLKDQTVLVKAVQRAISEMVSGPFAYAERWDEGSGEYKGMAIEAAANALIVIDSDSVIINPDVAEKHRPTKGEPDKPGAPGDSGTGEGGGKPSDPDTPTTSEGEAGNPQRFIGTVMISSDRPARDMHQIVEAVIEQLTTMPGSDVTLKLEIDAEVPGGLDRSKVRTILENANTLGFIDKEFK